VAGLIAGVFGYSNLFFIMITAPVAGLALLLFLTRRKKADITDESTVQDRPGGMP